MKIKHKKDGTFRIKCSHEELMYLYAFSQSAEVSEDEAFFTKWSIELALPFLYDDICAKHVGDVLFDAI